MTTLNVFDYLSPSQITDVENFTYALDCSIQIQNAINTIPVSGGKLNFPVGGYRIEHTLNIGNGTPTSVSTINGISLEGESFGYGINSIINKPPVDLKLFGTAHSGSIIRINGPINGVGVKNFGLSFNSGVGSVARGIHDFGASFSCFENIGVIAPVDFGIFESTNGLFGAQSNDWRNIFIYLGAIPSGATSLPNAQGIVITANNSPGSNDRFIDNWQNLNIVMSNKLQVGIQLQYCDSIKLSNVFMNPCGATAIYFNYLVFPGGFPAANTIWGIDVWDNIVSQSSGAPAGQGPLVNRIYNFSTANGAAIPSLANLKIIN